MSLQHHEAAELLEPFVLGALPADEAAAVALHLDDCAICRVEADRQAEIVDELAVSLPEREP